MTLSSEQEIAYKIVKLYVKHGIDEKQRKSLTLDKILDSYYYTLGRVQNRVEKDPFASTETTESAPAQATEKEEIDALSSSSSNAFSFLD